MHIIKTNWVNIVGVFLVTLFYVFINALLHSATPEQAAFGAFLLVCAYGFMSWGFFILALILYDLIFIVSNQRKLKAKLLSEWANISAPFIYWTIKYSEWVFAVAIIAFLITQLLRAKKIRQATAGLVSPNL